MDRLEDAGLVHREPVSTDRRAVDVALTPAGLDVVGRATRALNEKELFLDTGLAAAHEVEAVVAALSGLRAREGDFTPPENPPAAS